MRWENHWPGWVPRAVCVSPREANATPARSSGWLCSPLQPCPAQPVPCGLSWHWLQLSCPSLKFSQWLWGGICCWHRRPALLGGSCHHLPAGSWPGALAWLWPSSPIPLPAGTASPGLCLCQGASCQLGQQYSVLRAWQEEVTAGSSPCWLGQTRRAAGGHGRSPWCGGFPVPFPAAPATVPRPWLSWSRAEGAAMHIPLLPVALVGRTVAAAWPCRAKQAQRQGSVPSPPLLGKGSVPGLPKSEAAAASKAGGAGEIIPAGIYSRNVLSGI